MRKRDIMRPTMRMIMIFDEKRMTKFQIEEFDARLDNIFLEDGLKKEAFGIYSGGNNKNDLANFLVIGGTLSELKWFTKYIKEWKWYYEQEAEGPDDYEDLIEVLEVRRM